MRRRQVEETSENHSVRCHLGTSRKPQTYSERNASPTRWQLLTKTDQVVRWRQYNPCRKLLFWNCPACCFDSKLDLITLLVPWHRWVLPTSTNTIPKSCSFADLGRGKSASQWRRHFMIRPKPRDALRDTRRIRMPSHTSNSNRRNCILWIYFYISLLRCCYPPPNLPGNSRIRGLIFHRFKLLCKILKNDCIHNFMWVFDFWAI